MSNHTRPLNSNSDQSSSGGSRRTSPRKRAPGGGRKPKQEGTLYVPVSMRLHPQALEWAKAEAKRRGIGYQSLINEILLDKSGMPREQA